VFLDNIEDGLKKFKNVKALRLYRILTRLIKAYKETYLRIVAKIIYRVIYTGYFLSYFKYIRVIALRKPRKTINE
jgi:hypothetical protein